jgi:hypothetical protein
LLTAAAKPGFSRASLTAGNLVLVLLLAILTARAKVLVDITKTSLQLLG